MPALFPAQLSFGLNSSLLSLVRNPLTGRFISPYPSLSHFMRGFESHASHLLLGTLSTASSSWESFFVPVAVSPHLSWMEITGFTPIVDCITALWMGLTGASCSGSPCTASSGNPLPLEMHPWVARAFFSVCVPWALPHNHRGQLAFRNPFPPLFANLGAWNFWHWSQQPGLEFGTIEFHCVSIITHFNAVFCYFWRLLRA